jgi:hypothetical protein
MADLTGRRFAMLEPLEAEARPALRAVVEALVRPLADFAREPESAGRAYVRFLAALAASGELDRIGMAFLPQYERLAPVLVSALPGVSPATITFRLDLVSTPMLATLAAPEDALRHWHDARPSYDALVDELVDAITGTLGGGST